MTKIDRLDMLIKHYADGKSGIFADKLDVKPSTISSWKARNTFDIELIFAKCENINPIWLLSGEGEMLKSATSESTIAEIVHQSDPRNKELIFSKNDISKLLSILENKDKEINDLHHKNGKLEGKIEYLEEELKKRRENDAKYARTHDIANVG